MSSWITLCNFKINILYMFLSSFYILQRSREEMNHRTQLLSRLPEAVVWAQRWTLIVLNLSSHFWIERFVFWRGKSLPDYKNCDDRATLPVKWDLPLILSSSSLIQMNRWWAFACLASAQFTIGVIRVN